MGLLYSSRRALLERRSSYQDKVLGYDPIAYWPLSETSGVTAVDMVDSPNQDGTYTNGPLLDAPGIIGSSRSPWLDGTNDHVRINTATFRNAFNGAEGSVMVWFRIHEPDTWTDAATRRVVTIRVDANNWVILTRTNTNNRIDFDYYAGGVSRWRPYDVPAAERSEWVCMLLTWSASADEVRAYVNGAQVGAVMNGLGVWAGVPSATYCNIGSLDTAGFGSFLGRVDQCAVWDRPLTPTEVLALYTLSINTDFYYYIDATLGSDADHGLSDTHPWQTISKANGIGLFDDAAIFFKRGETFRDELQPNNGGSSGAPVVFDAYGAGANPIINGAQLITTWTPTVGDEFSAACAFTPGHVYADNTQLALGAGAGALNADEYFWVANVLHVRLASGDDPDLHTMEASYNVYNIEATDSYMTFRNFTCDKCKTAGIFASDNVPNLTDISFYSVDSIRAGNEGFRICGGGGVPGPNNVTLDDCTVELWDRDDNQQYPAIYQREGDGTGGDNLVVQNCLVDGWIPWGANTNLGRNGIRVDGGDSITLHNNEITGADHGINLTNTATAWDVAYNWVHETGDDGIFLSNLDDGTGMVYNNVFYRNSDQFIDLQTGTGDFGVIAFNTCYECLNTGVSLLGDLGMTAIFRNNLFVITRDPSQRHVLVNDVSGTLDIDDFVFDYNLYYDEVSSPVPNPFAWFESGANQTWANWQAAGRDVNGVDDDPDLVNPGGASVSDYEIEATSPAIGAGVAVVGVTDDYLGVARGTPPDIGAYEYVA